MSGGSYDYLCFASDLADLTSKREQLERMADRLGALDAAAFPGAIAAAGATRGLLVQLDLWQQHVEAVTERLNGVWRSVEWWDSGDTGPDGVVRALGAMLNPQQAEPLPDDLHTAVRLTWGSWRYPDGRTFGLCPECGVNTATWKPSDLAEDYAGRWAGRHRDACPKRCTAVVPRGGGVVCDLHRGHDDPGDGSGGHAWGAGPFTRTYTRGS